MNPVEEPADLTPLQRRYLCNLHQFCRTPPTIATMWMKALPVHILTVFMAALLCCAMVLYDMKDAALVLAGIAFGILLRDWGNFRRALLMWPATAAVVDRAKLAALTDLHSDDDPEQW